MDLIGLGQRAAPQVSLKKNEKAAQQPALGISY